MCVCVYGLCIGFFFRCFIEVFVKVKEEVEGSVSAGAALIGEHYGKKEREGKLIF